MAIDPAVIAEILNGERPYDHYETQGDEPVSLQKLKEDASEHLFNGPEGNIWILRLLEIIEVMQADH